MVKIGLVGFGKMGKQIFSVLSEKGEPPFVIVDAFAQEANYREVTPEALSGVDTVIDFSSPESVLENIKRYISAGVHVVMGTTGWYDKQEEVIQMVDNKIGFIWSGNFSLGVNLYFKIVQYASGLIGKVAKETYDPMVHEFHHKEKKDSPSGTAIMIAEIVKSGFENKHKVITEQLNRKRLEEELHVSSTRGGSIPGTHLVLYDSLVDTIELKHTARTREGFAAGAVTAAYWITNKKGVYRFEEIFENL